ncbi:MAG: nuclear transport factor 2 family protein [Mycobacterium sp.]
MAQTDAHRGGPTHSEHPALSDHRTLSDDEVLALHHLIADVSFAFDSGNHATQLPEVLTEDFVYERTGALLIEGRDALVKMLEGMTDPAVSHHTSTVSVHATGPDTGTCRSKVITFRSGGRFSFGEFVDSVRRDPTGTWRIERRVVRPLGESGGSDS